MASQVQGFHTIVLQVSDLDASMRFYEAALGVALVRQSERSAEAQCPITPQHREPAAEGRRVSSAARLGQLPVGLTQDPHQPLRWNFIGLL